VIQLTLDEALAALEAGNITGSLTWSCVDTDSDTELVRAAALFRQAAEGDPASHLDDDTLGFLKTLLKDEETAKASGDSRPALRGGGSNLGSATPLGAGRGYERERRARTC